MNAEVFAEWLRRQGHAVVHTQSSWWYDKGPRAYLAFPYHLLICPGNDELRILFREHRALCVRYSTTTDASVGIPSYHAVFDEPRYGFETLGRWARKNVRRGLRNSVVDTVSWERLANEGWELQADTLRRQNRDASTSKGQWRRMCEAAADLPGVTAWGTMVGGRLAASVITFQVDQWAYMLYQQCHRDYLVHHVNNALSFTVSQHLVEREKLSVFYALHSFDAGSNVDEFKFRMGYRPKQVKQRVEFNPRYAPLVNRASHAILRVMRAAWPRHEGIAKAEGLFRFYRESKLPPERQTLPRAAWAHSTEADESEEHSG